MRAILDRLREPSSWNAIALFLGGAGILIPADLVQPIALTGAGIAGLLGFFLREKGGQP